MYTASIYNPDRDETSYLGSYDTKIACFDALCLFILAASPAHIHIRVERTRTGLNVYRLTYKTNRKTKITTRTDTLIWKCTLEYKESAA